MNWQFPYKTKSQTKQIWSNILSIGLVFALLLGLVPHAVVRAAPEETDTTMCQVPTTETEKQKSFLPFITNSGALLASALTQGVGANALTVERTLRYEVGKTYVYEWNLSLNSQTVSRDSEGLHDNGINTTVVHANAEVSITGKDADGAFSGQVALHSSFICNTEGTEQVIVDDAEIAQALETPIRFVQTAQGTIASVSLPTDASPQVANLQKGVLNALQITLQDSSNSYQVEEQGMQGAYTASYTLEEKQDDLHITKMVSRENFSQLNQGGDDPASLTMAITSTIVFDGEHGIPSSIVTKEKVATGTDDEISNTPDGNYAGATIWSTVTSVSNFELKETKDTGEIQAAALSATYIVGELGGVLPEVEQNQQGIDLSQVDLDTELATLESETDNPAHFERILHLVNADSGTDVLDKINERLQANAGNDDIAKLYVDILVAIGTPDAQEILNGILGNQSVQAAGLAATLNTEVQKQALIGLVLVTSPTTTTVETVKSLSAEENESPLQETAISVLGATIKNLADEDNDRAKALTDGLVQSLSATTVVTDVQIYLDALGNSAMPSALPTIQSYISGTVQSAGVNAAILDNLEVKTAALFALRDIPGEDAENLLVAMLNNDSEHDSLRMHAANALAQRPNLSSVTNSALQSYQAASLAAPGLHRRQWADLGLGSKYLGLALPGGITVASPPYYPLFLHAYQQANVLVWKRELRGVGGSSVAYSLSNGKVYYNAYLSLGGNRIRKNSGTISCNTSRRHDLWTGSRTFLKKRTTFFVGPIPITINVRLEGMARLYYTLDANTCNISNSSISTSITPQAWARARGETGVGVPGISGGAGLSADVLRTGLPLSISAAYSGNSVRFCNTLRIQTAPLSGRIYGYAKFFFRKTWTIARLPAIPSYSATIWSRCT